MFTQNLILPVTFFVLHPSFDPFDSDSTLTSVRDARSVSGDSDDQNNSEQESGACHREACAVRDTDFGAFGERLNSETMHMTDIEANAMEAGFRPEEVKTTVREVTQTFRQRSLRNETSPQKKRKKKEVIIIKKIVLDHRNGNRLLLS